MQLALYIIKSESNFLLFISNLSHCLLIRFPRTISPQFTETESEVSWIDAKFSTNHVSVGDLSGCGPAVVGNKTKWHSLDFFLRHFR